MYLYIRIKNNNKMETLRKNGNYAIIVNKGVYGYTVYMGYTAGAEDICTKMKVYKTEKSATKAAEKFLN